MSQQQNTDMAKYFYRASAADFMKIPDAPIAYWLSKNAIASFVNGAPLAEFADPRVGLDTGENDLFIRFWHEVDYNKIGFNYNSTEGFLESGKRYVPHTKGGDFRKWYGNMDYVLKFNKPAYEALSKQGNKLPSKQFYFMSGSSWTRISSAKFSMRYNPAGFVFNSACPTLFANSHENLLLATGVLLSPVSQYLLKALSPTLNFQAGDIRRIPIIIPENSISDSIEECISLTQKDWDFYEASWDYSGPRIITLSTPHRKIHSSFLEMEQASGNLIFSLRSLERKINFQLINCYGLHDELSPEVPLEEITVTCNPHYRYGGDKTEAELETLLQCDTLKELVSYAIGCMMGRYSLDKPGLILASQGETLQDYLRQIPAPRFAPDDDAILPLTDQEWFADDATNRFREFIRVVWGDDTLQENLDFVAESLCLHAIKPKKGEASLDTLRRYLSTQFFKDHLRTYKKRPIYWLFSSGKHKAFECLVYLHRYHEGTLARMRTEYVIPLTAKLANYAKLEKDLEASTSTAEKKRLEKELATLHNQQAELATFDENLRHFADQRISLDLDDGVKVNYGKFGDLLAEVKTVTGGKEES